MKQLYGYIFILLFYGNSLSNALTIDLSELHSNPAYTAAANNPDASNTDISHQRLTRSGDLFASRSDEIANRRVGDESSKVPAIFKSPDIHASNELATPGSFNLVEPVILFLLGSSLIGIACLLRRYRRNERRLFEA